MKTILVTLILYIMAIPVQAGDWREACGELEKLATTIMENRQSGVSMAKMMEVVGDSDGNSWAEKLIIAAYDSPQYSTEKMQKRAVEKFRDEVYLECVKVMRTQNTSPTFANNPSKNKIIKFIQSKCNMSMKDYAWNQTVYLKNCTLIVEYRDKYKTTTTYFPLDKINNPSRLDTPENLTGLNTPEYMNVCVRLTSRGKVIKILSGKNHVKYSWKSFIPVKLPYDKGVEKIDSLFCKNSCLKHKKPL